MKSQLDSLEITRSYKALLDIHFLKISFAKATIFTILKKYLRCYWSILHYQITYKHILYIYKKKEATTKAI